jgi:hypothetical protein
MNSVAVGIRLSPYPPHRSGQADFPHPALASGGDAQTARGIRMADTGRRQPATDEHQKRIGSQPRELTFPEYSNGVPRLRAGVKGLDRLAATMPPLTPTAPRLCSPLFRECQATQFLLFLVRAVGGPLTLACQFRVTVLRADATRSVRINQHFPAHHVLLTRCDSELMRIRFGNRSSSSCRLTGSFLASARRSAILKTKRTVA